MAQLAIKGHPTRGKEIIQLLEMLGGVNKHQIGAIRETYVYFVDKDGIIRLLQINQLLPEQYIVYSLEEFEKKFPYKVGDKVITKDKFIGTITDIRWQGDSFFVGKEEGDIVYTVQVSTTGQITYSKDELQPYKEETMETITMDDFKTNTKEWLIDKLHNMIISDAIKTIGNIHDKLHKPEYPKTFIEVLNFWHPDRQPEDDYQRCYKKDLIEKFQDLLYARDAYWKIAGEQMGLGKAWEQDYDNRGFIIANNNGNIHTYEYHGNNNIILAFPTAEMRDAFYENFKELIEQCKELL